jgi:hypothetical protein
MSIVVPRCSTGIRLLFLCFRPVSRVQSNGFVHARVLQRDRWAGKAPDNSLILLALPGPLLPWLTLSGSMGPKRYMGAA